MRIARALLVDDEQLPAGSGTSLFAATSLSIVVERATYGSPGGVFWGRGANALATPLP